MEKETKKKVKLKNGKRQKTIFLPNKWILAIEEYQLGTVTSYIAMAVRNQMERDGILK